MYHFSISVDSIDGNTPGIQNLELADGCFGAPLHTLNGNQAEDIRNRLILSLRRVALYATDLPVREYDAYVRFFRLAHLLNIENVCLTGAALAGASDEEIRRVVAIAAAFSIRVLFKPEFAYRDSFDFPRYEALRSEGETGLIFDPVEMLPLGKFPYRAVLHTHKRRGDVVFLRVHDAAKETLLPALPGQGNSEIKECASGLLARGFKGYFSFVPYGPPLTEVIRTFGALLCEM